MPKPPMVERDEILESQIIETMLAGLKIWRPDLDFPQSYSDMQACVRGLLRMFDIKRCPVAKPLRIRCDNCKGYGEFMPEPHHTTTCKECGGRGWIEH